MFLYLLQFASESGTLGRFVVLQLGRAHSRLTFSSDDLETQPKKALPASCYSTSAHPKESKGELSTTRDTLTLAAAVPVSQGLGISVFDDVSLLVRAVRLVIVAVGPQHARQVGSFLVNFLWSKKQHCVATKQHLGLFSS